MKAPHAGTWGAFLKRRLCNLKQKHCMSADDISKAKAFYMAMRKNNLFSISGRFRKYDGGILDIRDLLTMIAYASHSDMENEPFRVSEECIEFECRAGRPTVVASRQRLLRPRAPWGTPALVKVSKRDYCSGGWFNGKRITLPCAFVRCGWLRYLSIKAKRMVARLIAHDGQHATAAIISPATKNKRDAEAAERLRRPYYKMPLAAFRYLPSSAVTALRDDLEVYKELAAARMLLEPGKVFSGPVGDGLVLVLSPPEPPVAFLAFLLEDFIPARAEYKDRLQAKLSARSKMAQLKAELEALWPSLEPCS